MVATGNYAKYNIGKFEKCPICKKYDWFGGDSIHRCPPKFLVCIASENIEDGSTVYAQDVETAVLDWVKRYDCDTEGDIAYNGKTIEIKIAPYHVIEELSEYQEILNSLDEEAKYIESKPEHERDEEDICALADYSSCVNEILEKIAKLNEQIKVLKIVGEYVPEYWVEKQ